MVLLDSRSLAVYLREGLADFLRLAKSLRARLATALAEKPAQPHPSGEKTEVGTLPMHGSPNPPW
jgi:hypothetical protein